MDREAWRAAIHAVAKSHLRDDAESILRSDGSDGSSAVNTEGGECL